MLTVTRACPHCGVIGPTEVTLAERSRQHMRCSSCAAEYRVRVLRPHPGPQSMLLRHRADVILFGGAAGSGKSEGLLMDALQYAQLPGWGGVIFRRNKKDLRGGKGSLFAKARKLFTGTGAVFREGAQMDIRWPHPESGDINAGATLEFRHLEDANVEDYQGLEYAWIGIDEATHLELAWILYLITRARTDARWPDGRRVQPVVRMSCNPDADHELREWVDWYLDPAELPRGIPDRSKSGTVRYWQRSRSTDRVVFGDSRMEVAEATSRELVDVKSFSFIAASLEDNPTLLEDNPGYRGSLAVHGAVVEAQLVDGDWNARPTARGLLRALLERVVDEPLAKLCAAARGWDKAYSEPRKDAKPPDFTAGALIRWDVEGNWYWCGLVVCRKDPPGVLALMRSTATLDGRRVTQALYQDPAAGAADVVYTAEHMRKSARCGPIDIKHAGNRANQKIVHATPVAEDLEQGRGYILAGDWLDVAYSDLKCPPTTIMGLIRAQVSKFPSDDKLDKDDIIDALCRAHAAGPRRLAPVGDTRKTMAEANEIMRKRMAGRGHRR